MRLAPFIARERARRLRQHQQETQRPRRPYLGRRREVLRRTVSEAEARVPDEPCALYGTALEVLYAGDRREAERLLQRLRPVGCEGADYAVRAAKLSADLRAQLWDWVRKSDRYLASPDASAPVLPR